MTDHELLLAISGIMDKKLIPIENRKWCDWGNTSC